MNARVVVMAHMGPVGQRLEHHLSLPSQIIQLWKNLELTKRKEGPAPSTPTPLSAARFYVVDILHCVVCPP